ncbi:hypothetical protein K443DRAFT_9968 [Laccaria amethystina LaAM-08-1]|uniref:Uncharacterized protein n=1 Tax=Laccaria amethystina LaAM-08-1 TaxID=1095629 RepID=A0A0C9WLM5_9AGAR|nr:hypothetical protein K443DRAFT_9968 [Laccaria amethystina LaAM-08-1]
MADKSLTNLEDVRRELELRKKHDEIAGTLQFQPPPVFREEPMKPTEDAPEQAMEVDIVFPTTMDVNAIRKPNIACDRLIFDFIPAPSDFNETGVSSSALGSNPKSIFASEKPASAGSNLSQVPISPACNQLSHSIFDFQAPPLHSTYHSPTYSYWTPTGLPDSS